MSRVLPGWLVINARPNQERVAVENLHRQGFDPYCPMIGKLVRHARRSAIKPRPLFPGYLFVRNNPSETRWRPILSTIGVRSLVQFGDTPGYLDDAFVAALRSCERDGLVVEPAARYSVGQSVEVRLPSYEGIVGQVLAVDDTSRITILIQMMQRSVKMQVTPDSIAPVGARLDASAGKAGARRDQQRTNT